MPRQAPCVRRGNSGNLAVTAAGALSFHTMKSKTAWCLTTSLGLALTSCSAGHTAQVRLEPLPPLPDPIARHTSRIVIQLPEAEMPDSQCVAYEGYQTLCFVGIRETLERNLSDLLWPSYREVRVRRRADALEPGDYLLQVELNLDALPQDASRYGWSAAAKGRWRVVRDGLPLEGESLSTRSRGDFAYGSGLGQGAGEVVGAVAAHIAQRLVRLPARDTPGPVLLPPVVARDSFTPKAPDEKPAAKAESGAKASNVAQPDSRAKTP